MVIINYYLVKSTWQVCKVLVCKIIYMIIFFLLFSAQTITYAHYAAMDFRTNLIQNNKYMCTPSSIGGIGIIYRLPTVSLLDTTRTDDSITLSTDVITGIFNGTITRWNDPLITSLNTYLTGFPDSPIIAYHRTKPSGTTFLLSLIHI